MSSADHRVVARSRPKPDGGGDWLDEWCETLARAYPPRDAEGWDQVGLHVGDPRSDIVTGVLVSLDVTSAVLDEAAAVGADLLIAHHPLLFSPLSRLTPHTAPGRITLKAARQGCAVLAAHTNVDKAAEGTSHPAADVLGLVDRRPLRPLETDPHAGSVKLVTFVPRADTDAVIRAMASAGAGHIGDYTECAFTTPGTGTFRPGEGTSPTIGAVGEREHVEEDRVEMVVARRDLAAVVNALNQAHPYEEVPVDAYPLVDGEPPATRGLGLVGRLPEPRPLLDLAATLADGLSAPHLRLATHDPDRPVRTVAVVGGSGDSLIADLLGSDGPTVDLLVTSDLKHHVTLDALTMGLSLIDAGHYATENPTMDAVVQRLQRHRDHHGLVAPIHRSTTNTDPWTDWRAR